MVPPPRFERGTSRSTIQTPLNEIKPRSELSRSVHGIEIQGLMNAVRNEMDDYTASPHNEFMKRFDHNNGYIAGFRLTCAQDCVKPRWFDAGPLGQNAETVEAQAQARRCPRCRELLIVTAIFADAGGHLPANTPIDVPGRRLNS